MPIRITDTAASDAARAGMYGNVKARLRRMVRLAAPITHPRGNCRYEQWLLMVVGDQLTHVESLAVEQPPNRRRGRGGPRRSPRVVYPKASECAVCGGTMTVEHFDPRSRVVITEPCPWRQDPGRGGPCDRDPT